MNVVVEGHALNLFKSFQITSSITDIADIITFETQLIDALTVNTEIEVQLDDHTPLFNARIDRLVPDPSLMGTWTARSITSILVDSCPIVETGEFKNRTTKQIIQAIAEPLGITVEGEDGEKIEKYNVELDATCASTITELCLYSGLLATGTTAGNLSLHKYYPTKYYEVYAILEENVNCNIKEFAVDSRLVASSYEVLGQTDFSNNNNTNSASNLEGTFPITKHARTITEMTVNSISIKPQAEWMQRNYEASVERLVVSVPGLRYVPKGVFVIVNSGTCRIYSEKRLVERVTYTHNEDGSEFTELVLVLPIKYGGDTVGLSGWVE